MPTGIYPRQSIEERFWSKVEIKSESECWEWNGSKIPTGYGRFGYNGRLIYAHRMAWILIHGEIPIGVDILHHCDNPSCVNYLSHLFEGTHQDNIADMKAKGRQTRGAKSGMAKLTESQIKDIRDSYKEGFSQVSLSLLYGVSQPTISHIVNNLHWKHIN